MPASDRKSTRLNSSHTVIYTLSLHDALPISFERNELRWVIMRFMTDNNSIAHTIMIGSNGNNAGIRSEEHTSELQSHSDLHSFPTRRSSDLLRKERVEMGDYAIHD